MIAPPRPRIPSALLLMFGFALGMATLTPAVAAAEEETSMAPEFHVKTALGIRGTPIGLNLQTDLGVRKPLFDSESAVLQNTYIDFGQTFGVSPAFLWAGGYVEALPVAILQLRASAQYARYFGSLGYTFPVDDVDAGWSLSDISDRDTDNGLSVAGSLLRASATPRYRSGRIVLTLETELIRLNLNSGAYDDGELFYEPFFDAVIPAGGETLINFKPTVGYLIGQELSNAYLLLGLRWDRMWVRSADYSRDIMGLVYVWSLPRSWNIPGQPQLQGVAGVFSDHPSRDISPYSGTQFVFDF